MLQSSDRLRSDRNLLFGVLAVQLNFISRDDLLAGMSSWVQDKAKPLGQILVDTGKLTAEQSAALDALIVQHVKAHDNDLVKSLRALSWASTMASWLTPIDDEDLQAGLSMLLDRTEPSTVDHHPSPNGARYQKLHRYDDGGQGIVWLARDTELDRNVALKEIKPDFADQPQTRGRLLLEGKVTGQLEHPGVVPIHDMGHDALGRPYYVMRFLSGGPLTAAINSFHDADRKPGRDASERSLAFRQLLRRFVDVCNAVAYAHSRGVLHRDLKPKNVMIGRFGETWVIDWGMTKTGVDVMPAQSPADEPPVQPPPGNELDETLPGLLKGTIPYMSPEQALGRTDLGNTSDVYSLGAILCELLAGQRAYTSDEKNPEKRKAAILAKVQKGEYKSPREMNPNVPPPLDAICRKAMSFAMKDRYESAKNLAEDIEHWLADEPVAAYPEPWTAKVGRWGRRHRAAVVGAAVFLVSAVVGLAVITAVALAGQKETEKQRRIAEANYATAREQFLNSVELIQAGDVHFASDPALHPKRKVLLKSALVACRDLFRHGLEEDCEMQKRMAVVCRYSANVHRSSDETEDAEPLYQEAIRHYEGLTQGSLEDAVGRQKLAETLRDQSSFFVKLGRLREATTNLERVRTLTAEVRKTDPNNAQAQQTEASVLLNLAFIAHRMGEKNALDETEKAVKNFEALTKLPAGTGHPYNTLFLFASVNQLAVIQRETGDLQKARETHRDLLKRINELVAKDAVGIAPADYFNIKAQCALEQGRTLARFAEAKVRKVAEDILGANAQQWKALASSYPWIPFYRDRQAVALQARGQLRFEDKRLDVAFADFDTSRDLLEKLVASHPRVASYHANAGKTYAGLGQLARAQEKDGDAPRRLGRAAASLGKAVELSPDDVHFRKHLDELPK